MLKNRILITIFGLITLIGCKKEDDLEPRKESTNWFEIKDKPGEYNQLVYQIYEETNIPIFVNDTLGTEYRGEDAFGNPVVHIELFSPGYYVFGQYNDCGIVLSKDTTAMIKAIKLINDRVIPNLPEDRKYRPNSYLLVDTLYTAEYGWSVTGVWQVGMRTAWTYNKSLSGIVVGKLSDINTMDEEYLKFWAGMILAANVSPWILENCSFELEEFYKATDAGATTPKSYYDWSINSYHALYGTDSKQYGFLEWMYDGSIDGNKKVVRSPSKEADIRYYIAVVYAFSESEFMEMINSEKYPKCLEKYRIMRKLVNTFKNKMINK